MTGDPLEALRATREERESERSQISQDYDWRNAEAVVRRASADRESIRKGPIESGMLSDGSDTIPSHVLLLQGNQLRS